MHLIISVFLYGSEEYVKNTTSAELYNRYLGMLNSSCITVIVSGNLSGYDDIETEIKDIFSDANSKFSYNELDYDTHNVNLDKNKTEKKGFFIEIELKVRKKEV